MYVLGKRRYYASPSELVSSRMRHGYVAKEGPRSRYEKVGSKMGLPLLTEKILSKIWTIKTWAVCEGDVPIVLAVCSILGGEQPRGGEAGPLGAWRGTLPSLHAGSTKLGSRTKEYSGTPMARWAGEGERLDQAYGATTAS